MVKRGTTKDRARAARSIPEEFGPADTDEEELNQLAEALARSLQFEPESEPAASIPEVLEWDVNTGSAASTVASSPAVATPVVGTQHAASAASGAVSTSASEEPHAYAVWWMRDHRHLEGVHTGGARAWSFIERHLGCGYSYSICRLRRFESAAAAHRGFAAEARKHGCALPANTFNH